MATNNLTTDDQSNDNLEHVEHVEDQQSTSSSTIPSNQTNCSSFHLADFNEDESYSFTQEEESNDPNQHSIVANQAR